jgi:glycosyltransferase involved in cell wall biosynthesis
VRVLLGADFYRPFIGGAERQTGLLAHELTKRGHEVAVATVWHAGLQRNEIEEGVAVRRLRSLSTHLPWFSTDPGRRFQPPWPDPAITISFRRLVQAFKPDVVHSWGWISYSAAASLWRARVPLVLSARDYGYTCATRTMMYMGRSECSGPALAKCLRCASSTYGSAKGIGAAGGVLGGRRLLAARAAAIHSVSDFVQTVVARDLRFPRGRRPILRVIPSFLEDEYLEDDPSAIAPPEATGGPFILFVGALEKHKGIDVLLEAYQRLDGPPRLVLIGNRQHPRDLPPNVTVLTDLAHAQVMALLRHCQFAVTPSLWPEPSAGVIREAMSQGRPVIATAVGGTTDMIDDDVSGLLVPAGNVDALARAMQRLTADEDLRASLGRAARRRMLTYSAATVVPQFEVLYADVVAASRG